MMLKIALAAFAVACQMSTSVWVTFKLLHIPWQADSWL